MKIQKQKGFTLIELLVTISVIGFVAAAATYSIVVVRKSSRDATRAGHVAQITRALSLYLNDVQNGYPVSSGECLTSTSTVGQLLIARNVIKRVPTDPIWPEVAPAAYNSGTDYAVSPSANFCYWYSGSADQFYLSYFLETSSKSGDAGIHVTGAGN